MYLKFIHMAVIVSMFVLTGCSMKTLHKSQDSSALNVSLKSKLAADLRVDLNKKLKGAASEAVLFGLFKLESTNKYVDGVSFANTNNSSLLTALFSDGAIGRAKSAAAYNALKKSPGVDVIISPQYILQVKSVFFGAYKKIKAVVTGYAGYVKRIRSVN